MDSDDVCGLVLIFEILILNRAGLAGCQRVASQRNQIIRQLQAVTWSLFSEEQTRKSAQETYFCPLLGTYDKRRGVCTARDARTMTTHDDSYADASFDLDESIDEDITDEAADDNTPARRINVVDSDGDDDDSIHPRARRSSPPEPSPRSSPEEEAGAPEMTTPPSTGRTRLSGGMASLPPLSPRRLSPMSPVRPRSDRYSSRFSRQSRRFPRRPGPRSPRTSPRSTSRRRATCRARPRRSCGRSSPGGITWRLARWTRATTTSSRRFTMYPTSKVPNHQSTHLSSG